MRTAFIFLCIALFLLSVALAVTPSNVNIRSNIYAPIATYFIEVGNQVFSMVVYEKRGCIWKVHIQYQDNPIYININNYSIYDFQGNKIN